MKEQRRASSGRRARGGVLALVVIALAGAPPRAAASGGPPLGAARSFVALGGSTLANAGPSVFTGDVGVSPGTAITGFPPGTVTGGGIHAGDAAATAAHADAAIAYAFLEGMASSPADNLTGTDLGGLTLAPGVYKFNTSAQLTGQLVLDAQGDSGALFVFQIGSTLTTSTAASVVVINGGAGYDASNVFWQVGSSATLGSATSFTGNILAYSSITIVSGSSMTGNALALNGAVTTDSNTNSIPPLVLPPVIDVSAPINLTATLTGTTASPRADLRWNDASNYETEFRVYRRDGAGPGFVQIATVPPVNALGVGGVVTWQDLGLSPATTYTYKVSAFSTGHGESARSNEALVDTDEIILPGVGIAAPLTLTAALSGTAALPSAELRWNDASDDETDFRVYRREGAGPDFALVGTLGTTDAAGTGGVVSYHDPALNVSTTYTYRVTAVSVAAGESAASNEALVDTVNFTPVVPVNVEPPLNLTAVLGGSVATPGGILSWTDVGDNETEFRVFRRDGAGPDFVSVGTVVSTTTAATGGLATFNDLVLDTSTTFTYRVTAFSVADGTSAPSNEALLDTATVVVPPTPPKRRLDVHLGRGRCGIRDRRDAGLDRVFIKGSYAVIDVDTSVPDVLHDANPCVDGVSLQVRAPGNLVFINIPANDPGWRVVRRGVYRWRTQDGQGAPATIVRIDTRRSQFGFRSFRNDFAFVPGSTITVSLTCHDATGSETGVWNVRRGPPGTGTQALFKLPR